MTGSVVGNIDVAQIVLYLFWLFFALLIVYLRREDKREGYPLESPRPDREEVWTIPAPPAPKKFHLASGETVEAPAVNTDTRPINAEPLEVWPGSPLVPIGDPMLAGVGPGSWAPRANRPDTMFDGRPRIVPIELADGFHVSSSDPDPVGMRVYGADGKLAGVVSEIWVDRAEIVLRYLEVEIGESPDVQRVMLPMNFAKLMPFSKSIRVDAINAEHFKNIPPLAFSGTITLLEEERIVAYYGGGTLYANERRAEPVL